MPLHTTVQTCVHSPLVTHMQNDGFGQGDQHEVYLGRESITFKNRACLPYASDATRENAVD
jgi:hypothetical protein